MSERLSRAAQIAQLNDQYRQNTPNYNFTSGIVNEVTDEDGVITPDTVIALRRLIFSIQNYDRFTSENDQYGEHDFGVVRWRDADAWWRIDYYDQSLEYGMDPLDPDCRRVLTVMRPEEA